MKKFTRMKLLDERKNTGNLQKKVEMNFPDSYGHT